MSTKPSTYAPNVYKAWGDVRKAVNRDLPVAFVAINHYIDGQKRKLRHHYKVKH
jgi:hypothetical protein